VLGLLTWWFGAAVFVWFVGFRVCVILGLRLSDFVLFNVGLALCVFVVCSALPGSFWIFVRVCRLCGFAPFVLVCFWYFVFGVRLCFE